MTNRGIVWMLTFLPFAAEGQIASRLGTEVKEVACASVSSRQISGAVRGSLPPGPVTISSVSPTFGKLGSIIVVNGTGLSAVTGASNGMPWSVKCDTQLFLTLAGTDGPYSSTIIMPNPYLQTAAGNVQLPPLQVLLPPKPSSLGPTKMVNGKEAVVIEAGQEVFIMGYALSEPPNLVPSVSISGAQLPIVSAATVQVRALIPPGTASGPLVFTTGGGSVTMPGTVTVLSGPTVFESISPSTASVGETVTVTGQNLFRLYGICKGGTPNVPLINTAGSATPWTNNSASFVVPQGWNGTVPVWMWVNIGGEIKCIATSLTLDIK